jgi:predicted GIY-YIG superfamily endonuclease
LRDRKLKSYPRNQFPFWKLELNSHPVYRVYVIQNAEGKFYTGISEDVELRLIQHNDGVSKWTKGRGPWVLRWTSEALSITDARKLENLIKRQKGGAGFYRLTGLTRPSGS